MTPPHALDETHTTRNFLFVTTKRMHKGEGRGKGI